MTTDAPAVQPHPRVHCTPRRRRAALVKLFELVVEYDLEGIVAKRKDGAYSTSTPCLKIKNLSYSQAEGRGELFNRSKVPRPR